MVLCNFIEEENNMVRYRFGAVESDITGIVVFDSVDEVFFVEKPPEKFSVSYRSLHKLYARYKKEFKKGVFREVISYQSV